MNNRKKIDVNPLNSIGPIIGLILFLVVLYIVAKTVFSFLPYIAAALFIATLVVNYQVVIDYVKMLFNLLKTNILMGIVAVALSVIFYPITAAFLLGKALLYKKLGQFSEEIKKKTEGQFVEYEEVKDKQKEITLELPELKPQSKKKVKIEQNRSTKKDGDGFSDYEELFD